jgi:hypothetical protein
MSREELELAVEWAAREGWNPGLNDAAAFFAADPGGFFVAEAEGEVVGAIAAVSYGRDFGFIGLYIVRPGMRGRRCGLMLAERAAAHLAGRTIGVDGVLGKQRQYAKFFGLQFAHRNIRFGGVVAGDLAGDDFVDLRSVPIEDILAFDRRYFPGPRDAFLRAWLAMPNAVGYACVADGLRGYGVIRQCREGFKVGPLFAETAEAGERLFLALCTHAKGQTVFLDVPEINATGVAMAANHGLREVFATARMYRGSAPELPMDGIFGVTTFELG